MIKRYTFYIVFLLLSASVFSQELSMLEKIKVPKIIDTLFIDHDVNNWSLRIFTNYKDHRFQLRNEDMAVAYTPSNPIGIGVGVATKKLLLDMAVNLKLMSKEPTERLDVRLFLMLHNHQVEGFFRGYRGFNLKNIELEDYFRKDIGSLSTGVNYMYIFNAGEYSPGAMKSGLAKQKRTAVSFGLGGFVFMNGMLADSSIVPTQLSENFNEQAEIKNLRGVGGGSLVGFRITVPFLKNFFINSSVTFGVGLMHKEVETETFSYFPTNPLLYQYAMGAVLGYNAERYYVNFSADMTFFETGLDFGNSVLYNTTIAKLAFGYKLGGK